MITSQSTSNPIAKQTQATSPWLVLRDRFLAEVGDSISQIVLFGSQARRDATPESDVDLLVIVKERTPVLLEKLRRIRYQVMAQYDFESLLTLLVVSEQEWKILPTYSAGLVKNIANEGIQLWPLTPAKTFLN